ncbi:MAG: ribosome-associated translation inhibitor RaiA [Patescibacteria group bacterium]|nr:ribosome-associated translation inhibitor RaiA [Patescibacteria group bacterium]MDD5164160.1 ribosome-associated translation inhibitor RaiA [Patescibacteria group bacterium]MDD5534506.1 ribosome-associated translation inhibitor RaiA [Patescibacteria group bacterium]
MEIKYFFQNITLSGELKDYLEEKVKKLNRFSDKIWEAKIDLSFNDSHAKSEAFRLELALKMPDRLLEASVRAANIQEAIDKVEEKIRKQLEHYRGIRESKKRLINKFVRGTKAISSLFFKKGEENEDEE